MPCAPLKFDECSIREVFRNHMTRHVPLAQASPEQIVLRAEVIHPPLAFAGDSLLCLFRIGLIVGYDELDVPAQFLSRDRPRNCGQRMRWRTDGHHSGREVAAGRYAPRARRTGGFASEGFRNGNLIPGASRIRSAGRPGSDGRLRREKDKATNRTFEDHFVFAITVRNGKVTNIREYIDAQAQARASQMDASGLA